MNSKLIFSQAGVFRLQQLASLIFRHSGVRHRLSSSAGQIDLLRAGTQSRHPDVQQCCAQLADELNAEQLAALRVHGVMLSQSSVLANKAS